MRRTPAIGRVPVRDVRPAVECGRRPAKAVAGETFEVTATVFREGHDAVGANVVLRDPNGRRGPWTPMRELSPGSDRWGAEITPDTTGRWTFRVEAWSHPLATWRHTASVNDPMPLLVERERALFGSWYEFFPRSEGTAEEPHGTFRTAARRLKPIADMGFDVVYLPPIHPIGTTFRKGRNNTLTAGPDDVGVPWAIGSPEGGHDAVHPGLGTLEDFDFFVGEAKKLGLEIALDFALQCSPDHPWVHKHPEWFHHRPDGTIAYAENPPKKYQDIYP
uniref:maltotransferase domain-containing protein n=1 Tax=Streptomyces flaveus TaxID=66370 RepID=UPI0004C8038B